MLLLPIWNIIICPYIIDRFFNSCKESVLVSSYFSELKNSVLSFQKKVFQFYTVFGETFSIIYVFLTIFCRFMGLPQVVDTIFFVCWLPLLSSFIRYWWNFSHGAWLFFLYQSYSSLCNIINKGQCIICSGLNLWSSSIYNKYDFT